MVGWGEEREGGVRGGGVGQGGSLTGSPLGTRPGT